MDPIINHDEFIGKTVGRRTRGPDLSVVAGEADASARWRDAGFGVRVPRGVYRFRSFEDADAWMTKHLTRKRAS